MFDFGPSIRERKKKKSYSIFEPYQQKKKKKKKEQFHPSINFYSNLVS